MPAPSTTASETSVATQERIKKEMATLINPSTGARQAVEVGSQDAQGLFGQGFVLEKSPGVPVVGAKQATAGQIDSGKPVTSATPVTSSGKFVAYTKALAENKAKEVRDTALNADTNYDTQLQMQIGGLNEYLLNKALSPTDPKWRWLDPKMQMAIQNNDENAIKNALVGVKSIIDLRVERRKEEELKAEKEEAKQMAKAETAFDIYSKIGFDSLDVAERVRLESSLGLPTGTLDDVITKQNEKPASKFEYRSTERGGFVEFELDPVTGQVLSQRTLIAPRGLVGNQSSLKSKKEDEDTFSFEEFRQAYVDKISQYMSFEEGNENMENQIKRLWDEYLKSVGKETLARDSFSNANLQKGATNAGMTITEFGLLTEDEANRYIYGDLSKKTSSTSGGRSI